MDILLALLVLALGFLLYSAWQLMRARHREALSAQRAEANGRRDGHQGPSAPRRALQRISAGQLMEVLASNDDLVLIDLRPADEKAPLPVRVPHVVRPRTHQLEELLQQLPETRSAVFYGASDLSLFMITTRMVMRGSAPLYVLRPEHSREERA